MLKVAETEIKKIAQELKNGSVVALPTETVYGLAIALNSPTALEKLIYLKRREVGSGKIFTLVPEAKSAIANYAIMTHFTETMARKLIPGELTLILHKNPKFKHPYYDHFKTIGIRIPRWGLFRDLLPESGPLILTSANPRGATPARTAAEVEKSLPQVDLLVEGKAGGNPPSTILDCTTNPAKILRTGRIRLDNFDQV